MFMAFPTILVARVRYRDDGMRTVSPPVLRISLFDVALTVKLVVGIRRCVFEKTPEQLMLGFSPIAGRATESVVHFSSG
jgi:hypothetical protein